MQYFNFEFDAHANEAYSTTTFRGGCKIIDAHSNEVFLPTEKHCKYYCERKVAMNEYKQLIETIRSYENDLWSHCSNTAELANGFCQFLEIDKNYKEKIVAGALIHDIGKTHIPIEILQKTTPLTGQEWEQIMQHPEKGFSMLPPDFSNVIKEIVKYHHEACDGSGYPSKITVLPLHVVIVSICDKYDAMTRMRSYKPPISRDEARNEIRFMAERGQLPELITRAFLDFEKESQVSSCVVP